MEIKRVCGFTLVELMIVVAIVGILSAIAFPSYQEHVNKSRRTEAMTALLDGAQSLERYYSANSTYATAKGSGALAGVYQGNVPSTGLAVYYTIASSGAVADASYTLQATRAGIMAGDRCGDFQIDYTGKHTVVNHSFADDQTALNYCWRR